MTTKVKEAREWINLGVTVLGPILITWLVWSIDSKLDNQKLSIEAHVSDTYVSKTWYESDRTETNKRLDTISQSVQKIETDVATMKGRQERSSSRVQ